MPRAKKKPPGTNRMPSDQRSAPVPIKTAPGQTYGDRTAQRRQQQAVRMAPPPSSPMPATQAQASSPPPGLLDPTGSPDTPLTAGAARGPGPGPEALTAFQAGPRITPAIANLARHLPVLELQASRPDATPQFRNFVFRLRSLMPPNTSLTDL